jgi:general stress protein 26
MEKINNVSVKKEYEIKNWDKYSHLEGFYMTNIRSSRTNFIKGKKSNNKAIWFESDIKTELNEGINKKSKIRINLYYKDDETDPNKYKFIVRRFKESKQSNCSNTTMYNT